MSVTVFFPEIFMLKQYGWQRNSTSKRKYQNTKLSKTLTKTTNDQTFSTSSLLAFGRQGAE